MTDDGFDIHLDPVADGQPSHSPLLLGGAVIMALVACYALLQGEYIHTGEAIAIAGWMLLYNAQTRTQWRAGYYRAAESIYEQLDDNLSDDP
jgi:anthranilate phosphoribosyltransferase